MRTIAALIEDILEPINILVFGPGLDYEPAEEMTRGLQRKRREIRGTLERHGHYVQYGEEVVDPSLPPPADNALLQELMIMEEYDLIIVLMQTTGTIVEATAIALNPTLARKTLLFVNDSHRDGLARTMCELAEVLGADIKDFVFPGDIDDCHLLTRVLKKVHAVQVIKGFSG